jgi:hypothetical protein
MRRTLAFITFAALAAAPSSAANRACNSTLVGQTVCRNATNLVLFYDAPLAAFQDLRDAIVTVENYQTEVPCNAVRAFDQLTNGAPSKVLVAAGVTPDGCTLGVNVANPQTTGDFADAIIDRLLRNKVIAWKFQAALDAVEDISTIPTPDTGAP